MEQTVKCPICKEPYTVYSHYAGDQSACPECRAKAKAKEMAKSSFNKIKQEISKQKG